MGVIQSQLLFNPYSIAQFFYRHTLYVNVNHLYGNHNNKLHMNLKLFICGHAKLNQKLSTTQNIIYYAFLDIRHDQ